jgi:hemerythrin-like domain-containing protein
MALAYARKQSLCDQLEAIADSLPHRVDRMECVRVANVLLPFLRESHRYEEEVLFPAFERGLKEPATGGETVRRLKSEHIYDACAAEEITEQLMWIGRGGDVANPEAFGFMLRAFFDPVRRHIAFERDHIIPAAGLMEPDSAAGDGF